MKNTVEKDGTLCVPPYREDLIKYDVVVNNWL